MPWRHISANTSSPTRSQEFRAFLWNLFINAFMSSVGHWHVLPSSAKVKFASTQENLVLNNETRYSNHVPNLVLSWRIRCRPDPSRTWRVSSCTNRRNEHELQWNRASQQQAPLYFLFYCQISKLWSNIPHWIRFHHNFSNIGRLQIQTSGWYRCFLLLSPQHCFYL